ncbi:MAG: archease [Verrucomicrobiia bacterium]
MTGWEHFEHKGDIGIRGFGRNIEEAFQNVALAMTAVITDPDIIALKESVEIDCSARDVELLLVEWLNAVLCQMDIRKMVFGKYEVRIEGENLYSRCWGERIDIERHQPAVEVKAATYCQLKVCRDLEGIWVAQCVVDV